MWVITPARGLFYCFDAKVGGDCLALVQHITGDAQNAAAFLSPTGSAHNSPAPEQKNAAATKKETAFDPVAFASKLQHTEQVEQLGFTEARRKTSLSASTAARFTSQSATRAAQSAALSATQMGR
jgi:hypothetical protein